MPYSTEGQPDMGYYINPTTMTKEAWLKKYVKREVKLQEIVDKFDEILAAGDLAIVCVDNGYYLAIGVGIDMRDVMIWKTAVDNGDDRPTRFYVVSQDAKVE